MAYAITATTRQKRKGEVHGRNHFFYSRAQFLDLMERNEFLEHANVYGNLYGVPKEQVRQAMAEGKDAVVRIDVQGAATVRKLAPDALLIFIAAPSMEELERRLTSRNTESPEQLAIRIRTARDEVREASWFDCVVVNETDQVENTVAQIVKAIDEQRHRQPPRVVKL